MNRRTAQCKKGAERKQQSMAAEDDRVVTSRSFSTYGHPLDMVTSFKYLGQVISAADDNWLAVVINLAKAQALWRRLTRIISREEAALRVSKFFFKLVVQSVLLFGTETWVVTPLMGRVLGGVPGPGGAMIDREAPASADRR